MKQTQAEKRRLLQILEVISKPPESNHDASQKEEGVKDFQFFSKRVIVPLQNNWDNFSPFFKRWFGIATEKRTPA